MIDTIQNFIIPAALSLLPKEMTSDAAKVMLLATGLQESGFTARRQRSSGPAQGFWQFEHIGVVGVLTHPASIELAYTVTRDLVYTLTPPHNRHSGEDAYVLHAAIAHNDVLACVLARLLLWTHPAALPTAQQDVKYAWEYYRDLWRPGRPHRESWDVNYLYAWNRVHGV